MNQNQQVILTEAEQTFEFYPRPPILHSLYTGWHGFGLTYMCQPGAAIPEVSTPRWHSLGIFTHGNYVIHGDRKLDGCRKLDKVVGGDVVITPANVGHEVAWDREGDFIILAIETDFFARVIDADGESEKVELLPYFATPDPLIYQIGLALKGILETNTLGSRLYAESMVSTLSLHLMQHYCQLRPKLQEYANGLPQMKLRQIIDYIYAHLDSDLGLIELAGLVSMSPHYFSQLFKQSTGMTPHQFVIRTRAERAKELILQGKMTLADIALAVGFANQSHLNVHFKRLFGVTPKKILLR
jgi:AraC family transcriptional regulator